jgi:hypothetical protein
MTVRYKFHSIRDLQMMFRKTRWQQSYRINIHITICSERVMKIDGPPINQNQVDFRMRDAARFDHILY